MKHYAYLLFILLLVLCGCSVACNTGYFACGF